MFSKVKRSKPYKEIRNFIYRVRSYKNDPRNDDPLYDYFNSSNEEIQNELIIDTLNNSDVFDDKYFESVFTKYESYTSQYYKLISLLLFNTLIAYTIVYGLAEKISIFSFSIPQNPNTAFVLSIASSAISIATFIRKKELRCLQAVIDVFVRRKCKNPQTREMYELRFRGPVPAYLPFFKPKRDIVLLGWHYPLHQTFHALFRYVTIIIVIIYSVMIVLVNIYLIYMIIVDSSFIKAATTISLQAGILLMYISEYMTNNFSYHRADFTSLSRLVELNEIRPDSLDDNYKAILAKKNRLKGLE